MRWLPTDWRYALAWADQRARDTGERQRVYLFDGYWCVTANVTHNHPPHEPWCPERIVAGRVRGGCL